MELIEAVKALLIADTPDSFVSRRVDRLTVDFLWHTRRPPLWDHKTLTHLPAGSRLLFPSGAGLVCEGENRPCQHPGEVIQSHHPGREGLVQEFIRAAKGRRGIVCTVERPGLLRTGDTVRIIS